MKFKKKFKVVVELNPDEMDKLYAILKACANLDSDQFLMELAEELRSHGADWHDGWQDIGRYSINYGYEDIPF